MVVAAINQAKATDMATIEIRFNELLSERSAKEGRRITLQQVSAETGITHPTLTKWNKGTVDRIDVPTLVTLCIYFRVGPGDLLKLVE